MKRRILSSIMCLFMVCSCFCIGSVNVVASEITNESTGGFLDRLKNDFDLVWSDEFNSDTLDTSKWQYDSDNCFRNNEAQVYSNGPEDGNVYMEDGKLVLKAKKETAYSSEGKTKNYTSGEISTNGKKNFRYGYFEFSAKIPRGDNTFPAIWMMGYDYKLSGCDWPHSGEIDIMESLGGGYTWSTLHYSRYGQSGSGSHTTTGAGKLEPAQKDTLYTDYHKYWMYWTDKYIVIGVDEGIANIIDITTPALAQSFRNYDHYIIFDFAMGPFGNAIKEADTDDWHFSIDYARVYQPKDNSMYDDYNLVEAESTISDNPNGVIYSDIQTNFISNAKTGYINSTINTLKTGNYDIYTAYKSKKDDKIGTYKTSINGTQIGTFTNSANDENSAINCGQKKIGTIKIDKDNLPFELRFDYLSGKSSDLQIDKYMFVKSDEEPDFTVTELNKKEILDKVTISSESEFVGAYSNLKEGGTIKLENDITLTSTIVLRKPCTIDLNGFTLNCGTLKNSINLSKTNEFTIKNGKIVANGTNGSLNGIICANEVYNMVLNVEDIDFSIGAKTVASGNAIFREYYGGCAYNIKNCNFNFTATSGDTESPIFLSGGDSGTTNITYNNCVINGNDYVCPFRMKNGGNASNIAKTFVYNTEINNCNTVCYSKAAITQNANVTFANSSISGCSQLSSFAENMQFINIADNNVVKDNIAEEIELSQSLTDFSVECTHKYSLATCTSPEICEYCYDERGKDLGGHKPSEAVVTDSDCINAGKTVVKCSVCDEVLSEEAIPIKEHKFELYQTVEPSCAQAGYKLYKCTECELEQMRSYTDDAMPAKVSHTPDLSKRVVVNPTCTSGGKITDVCSVCNKTYVSTRYRGQHKYVESIVKGDCENQGYTLHKCSICGDEYKTDITEPTGTHVPDESTKQVVPPTCTQDGYTQYTCTVCGETYKTDIIAATGNHTPDESTKQVVPPTCTQDGYTQYTCTVCNETYKTDVVEKLAHTPVTDEAVAATCTQSGLTEGSHCSVCNATIVAQTPIVALGHSFTNYVSNNDATCTADGTKTAKCDRCDETDTVADLGSAKGHTLGVWETTKEPTCAEKGEKVKKCTVCNEIVETEEIDALGHTYTTKVVKPTCTAKGYTLHTCSTCKTSYKDNYTNAIGHKYAWVTTTKATYFAYGKKSYKCSRCGKVYKTVTVAKLKLKKPTIKLTAGSKKITVKYGKISGAKKYEVSIKIGKKWYKYTTIKTYFTKSKLKKGTRYYVKVKALTTSGSKKAYSSYSSAKSIKAK